MVMENKEDQDATIKLLALLEGLDVDQFFWAFRRSDELYALGKAVSDQAKTALSLSPEGDYPMSSINVRGNYVSI